MVCCIHVYLSWEEVHHQFLESGSMAGFLVDISVSIYLMKWSLMVMVSFGFHSVHSATKQDHVHVDFLDIGTQNEARNHLLPEHQQKCFHKYNHSVVEEPVNNCWIANQRRIALARRYESSAD